MSERELVRLETIREIKPIEGADNIETAVVRGWNVVVGKGEFNVGDNVVFFEVDSFLPVTDERFAFLAPRGTKKIERDGQEVEGHVLRTAKLRGQVSQGLVLPASQFGDEILTSELFSVPLADTLGVFKYEPPIPANLAGQIVGKFPTQYARKTDSERVQNLVDVFEELRDNYDWIPTYKYDGCLLKNTPITMADGSSKHIEDVRIGDYVLGTNAEGDLVPSKVLNTFINGATDTWLNVSGKRVHRSAGNYKFAVKATPNHKFFTPDRGYVAASDLSVGDTLLCLHQDITPTTLQKSILLGCLLGDGTLSRNGNIIFSHSVKQRDYHQWIIDALGPVVRTTNNKTSGYGSEMLSTLVGRIYSFDDMGWAKARGVVPSSIVEDMNPIVAAVWYMDDGTLLHSDTQYDRAAFSTHSFSMKSIKLLQKALKKMGVESSVDNTSKGPMIRLKTESSDFFFALIAPYVPPSMQYKLPEYYRGNVGWIPQHTNGYRQVMSEVRVEDISPWGYRSKQGTPLSYKKYDIETETHNFFASKILVHNSSVTIIKDENGAMRYCSRNWQLSPTDDLSSKVVAERYGIPDMMPNNSAIQAELVGPGIQGNRGGFPYLELKIFAYWVNGEITPPEARPIGGWHLWAEEVADFEFPNSVEEAVQQVTGLRLPNGRLAEGVVWHTANGETVPYLDGRSTFKVINPSYLLKHGE